MIAAVLLLLPAAGAGPGSGLLHDDAESGTDAPNECMADRPSSLDLIRDATYGQVQAGDPADVYTLELSAEEKVVLSQDLPPEGTFQSLQAPHLHPPHGGEVLPAEIANPFGIELLYADCTLHTRSDDPDVLPRQIAVAGPGTFQVLVFALDGTTAAADEARETGGAMCHPPCNMDGYRLRAPLE